VLSRDVKDAQWWEDYFSVGGGWEANGGRQQTLLFGKAFAKRANIEPLVQFSLLDVGCALGDALKHFSVVFPRATLYGLDWSKTAIERCRTELNGVARFEQGDIADIQGHYDIIYCSNTLEHSADYDVKARMLTTRCSRLCVLVPYRETSSGQPLQPDPRAHHQHTFYRESLDFLVQEGLAARVSTHIFSCPGAWGWSLARTLEQELKNVIRPWVGRPRLARPRQIFYDVCVARHPCVQRTPSSALGHSL
jgi:SAM-dependent methyltransferase